LPVADAADLDGRVARIEPRARELLVWAAALGRRFTPELLAEVAGLVPCLDLYRVRWIRSYWSADRRRMICEYEAPDAESVRAAQQEAQARFDRVWAADLCQP
jgi:hypothetical protein